MEEAKRDESRRIKYEVIHPEKQGKTDYLKLRLSYGNKSAEKVFKDGVDDLNEIMEKHVENMKKFWCDFEIK